MAPGLVDALVAVGHPDVARLARRALDTLGISGELTVEAIDAAMKVDSDARDAALEGLDVEYHGMAVDLAPALLKFIKLNQGSVVLR